MTELELIFNQIKGFKDEHENQGHYVYINKKGNEAKCTIAAVCLDCQGLMVIRKRSTLLKEMMG
jgi:hypothetical protein